jgi:threonyl-tRNA synthetase
MAVPINHIRHTLSHLLAMAVLKKFPSAKLGIGPVIENGFYYDFKLPRPLAEKDLPELEARMREIAAQGLSVRGERISPQKARALFAGQPFKLDLVKEFVKEKKNLTVYRMGSFTDLCKGGHAHDTSEINLGAFKLTRTAGAYWRGNEKKPMLTRIYGIAFASKEELENHLAMQEEARKRDHRKLGQELGLFLFHETAPGMPYWLPKGLTILNELIRFWRDEHRQRGYQEIRSPLLNKKELYEISGHWDHYRQDIFLSKTPDGEVYGLKPMNCPNAMIVFGSEKRSWRDLPLRLSDTDMLHRYERSGTLNGLLRTREFSQDDAHIFVPEDEIKEEYGRIFEIVERFYSVAKLDYSFRLCTRPKKFMGEKKLWDRAEKELKTILEEAGNPFSVLEGDGAFYGPKIDILMKDALGREWQMGTIQLDFQIPRRFRLSYTDRDGKEKTPAVIHRVVYGSLERFVGILLEHTGGALPAWLAPIQATILPVSEKTNEYAQALRADLDAQGLRAEADFRQETLGKKIRDAELQKIPFLLIVGEKEAAGKTIAVRERKKGDLGQMRAEEFLEKIRLDAPT